MAVHVLERGVFVKESRRHGDLAGDIFSGMFKRHNEAEINRLTKEAWLRAKAQGKKQFVWREMLSTLPLWLGIVFGVPAMEAYRNHSHFSVRSTAFIALIMLPIFLLGAYLTAGWRWKDFEKKYPEDSLPPWQA